MTENKSNSPTDNSYQSYQDYFFQAQTNVTNCYLNYLDCRIKKMSFGVFNMLKKISNNINYDIMLEDVLDLGPGEVINKDKILKYNCYKVIIGELISKAGCILYRHSNILMNISKTGELTSMGICSKFIRVNSTHILRASTDDVLILLEYKYLSMVEEENTLSNTPKVIDSAGYIIDLLKNQSSLNLRRSFVFEESFNSSPNVSSSGPSFFEKIWNFFSSISFFSIIFYFIIGGFIIAFLALAIFLIDKFNQRRRNKEVEPRKDTEKEVGLTEDSIPKKRRERTKTSTPKQLILNNLL